MPDKRLKQAVDSSLSAVRMNEFQREKMIQTITKQEDKTEMKKTTKLRVALVVAAAVMLMSFTVLATQSVGWVNWKGEFTPDDPTLSPTPTAAPNDSDQVGLFREAMALLQDVPEGEYWYAGTDNGGWGHVTLDASLTDLEELRKEMADLPLRLPKVPEGYEVKMIQKSYDSYKIVVEDEPYAEEEMNGLTLSKYRVREVPQDAWEGYEVVMANAAGQRIDYSVYIVANDSGSPDIYEPEDAEGHFRVDDDTTATALKVEGFDRAIRTSREGSYSLQLQRDGKTWDENGQWRYWIANYYIWSHEMFDVGDILE